MVHSQALCVWVYTCGCTCAVGVARQLWSARTCHAASTCYYMQECGLDWQLARPAQTTVGWRIQTHVVQAQQSDQTSGCPVQPSNGRHNAQPQLHAQQCTANTQTTMHNCACATASNPHLDARNHDCSPTDSEVHQHLDMLLHSWTSTAPAQ